MSLPMALDILVPLPQFLGKIPEFNAMTAMLQNVCALDNIPNPKIPTAGTTTAVTEQTQYLPDYRCDVAGTDLDQAWDKTKKIWGQGLEVGIPEREVAVRNWVEFFGWQKEDLKWGPPLTLIGELDQEFLGAPFISVAIG
jgi:hypothetical protein